MRTGALVQSIDIGLTDVCYVDVDERHVFVCEPEVLRVFSRGDGGEEVLRVPRDVWFSKIVGPSSLIDRDPFVSVLSLVPTLDECPPIFIAGECGCGTLALLVKESHIVLFVSPCIQGRSRSRGPDDQKPCLSHSGL